MTIKVKVINDAGAKRTLRVFGKALKNLGPAHQQMSIWLDRWVQRNFKTEGGKVKGWKPFKYGGRLMPDGSIDRDAKLLQDTGRLRASFKPMWGKDYAGIGADAPYSIYHELGTRHLPIRRMLPNATDKEVNHAIRRIYNMYLNRAISRS